MVHSFLAARLRGRVSEIRKIRIWLDVISSNPKCKCWKNIEVCSIQAAIAFVTQITDQMSSDEASNHKT